MAVAVLTPEILDALRAGNASTSAIPAVLDDLSLTVERECPQSPGEVPEATAAWVGRLRRIGGRKLRSWGLDALIDDAQLLISELVTNGFRYGTEQQITFRLVIGTEVLVLQVDDGSPELPQIRDADPHAVSGRGLLLVDAVATAWGVSGDGRQTWCTLRFPAKRRAQ
ncbi:hypothetical protein SRB5_15630 [Streptomyces sp. RB5]|uniref:Uncharacterized protein n=1 Tax=Streptomyces smaragdinus TaxID=2585196 RepID=A0A7K0CD98_9ACTN|nr:ATP-binding protein [Streptomyces smaragdinus]MQY11445.1 hypothetical protein [Streptomyces smaragdinus]